MSKAFTKDTEETPPVVMPPREVRIPPDVINYITPAGFDRLRAELEQLTTHDRPALMKRVGDPSLGGAILELEAHIAALEESIARAEVVDPLHQDTSRVLFGATVTVRDEHDRTHRYRIVGIEEADVKRGWISWLAPLAKTLLGHHVGETVVSRTPRGEEELEIESIVYESDEQARGHGP